MNDVIDTRVAYAVSSDVFIQLTYPVGFIRVSTWYRLLIDFKDKELNIISRSLLLISLPIDR